MFKIKDILKKQIFKSILLVLLLCGGTSIAQQATNKQTIATKQKANDLIYGANNLVEKEDFIAAEMEYRKAISEYPDTAVGNYNLAHSFYKKGTYDEALYVNQLAAKNAVTKEEKHRAYHNIGNILMQNKLCKEAVESYKNALRNNPTDDETRYNLALAKDCAKDQEGDGEEDKKDDKGDDNKEDQDKKEDQGDDKDENKDQGDQDKKEGEDEKDETGDPKEDKQDKGKGDENQKQEKPKPGQLSPQQIKNILEAMNNQEQKVQQKINADKQKGAKVKTEKDW